MNILQGFLSVHLFIFDGEGEKFSLNTANFMKMSDQQKSRNVGTKQM